MRTKFFIIPIICLMLTGFVFAQDGEKKEAATKEAAPTASPTPKMSKEEAQGISVVELSLLLYSNGGGRPGMNRIRKTWVEFGNIEFVDGAGRSKKGKYEYRSLRGDSMGKTKIRFDHQFPDGSYALVLDNGKLFGVSPNFSFNPDPATRNDFFNRVWRGLWALFRYRENGSKVRFLKDEKVMGVDYAVIRLTDKENRETDYFISKKTFRVMMLKYEDNGVKYKRKFYDYNYAQSTLFPYRTVLWANEKKVEEKRTQTVTFGQELEGDFFEVG